MKILFSAIFSCLFIWLVAALFTDSVSPWGWSPELKQYIHPQGLVYQMRSQGWATTHLGKYGIAGIPDISQIPDKKIVLWGDSYVEAWQVDDPEKMSNQLTTVLHQAGVNWTTAGVGRSGSAMADYYFGLPYYEAALQNVQAHIIFFTQPNEDIIPDIPLEYHSLFLSLSSGGFAFQKESWEPRNSKVKLLLHRAHLDFMWQLLKKIKHHSLRFGVSTVGDNRNRSKQHQEKNIPLQDPDKIQSAFAFLTEKLRQQTKKPIIIVYGPNVPRIENNAISFQDKSRQLIRIFADGCQNNGILFLDLTEDFNTFYQKTGRFPRGFFNSGPARGHLNRDGHALVAQSLYRFLLEHNILQVPEKP